MNIKQHLAHHKWPLYSLLNKNLYLTTYSLPLPPKWPSNVLNVELEIRLLIFRVYYSTWTRANKYGTNNRLSSEIKISTQEKIVVEKVYRKTQKHDE